MMAEFRDNFFDDQTQEVNEPHVKRCFTDMRPEFCKPSLLSLTSHNPLQSDEKVSWNNNVESIISAICIVQITAKNIDISYAFLISLDCIGYLSHC